MTWLFLPAILVMLFYGLGWLLLGLAIGDPYDGGGWVFLLWLGVQVMFGVPIYICLVEVMG